MSSVRAVLKIDYMLVFLIFTMYMCMNTPESKVTQNPDLHKYSF